MGGDRLMNMAIHTVDSRETRQTKKKDNEFGSLYLSLIASCTSVSYGFSE